MKPRRSSLSTYVAHEISIVCIALFVAGIPSTAWAAGVVGTGTAASCTDAALDAVLADGGLVTFNCGPDPVTIDISPDGGGSGTKTISTNTTLDGGGLITISGGNRVEVFMVNAGVAFEVRNVTIADGAHAANGGGVCNDGTLTVTNSTFANNNTDSANGGGIYNNGMLTVSNSTFLGNNAIVTTNGANGGGIYNNGMLTVSNSMFSGNNASSRCFPALRVRPPGGVLSSSATEIRQQRGTESVREHSGLAHAVAADPDVRADLGYCIDANGGAVLNLGTMTVTSSTFSGNSAATGGGIDNVATLTVTDTVFSGNGGSAIDNGGTLTVSRSTFSNNFGYPGAAISNAGLLMIDESTVSGNGAADPVVTSVGVFNLPSGRLTVANSMFSRNFQAGIVNDGTTAVTNTTFFDQHRGAAIINAGPLTVTNSTFSGDDSDHTYWPGVIWNTSFCGDAGNTLCPATLRNTLVAHTGVAANCNGTLIDGGHNLDSDGTCGVGPATDPLFDPAGLAHNGGPTQTVALLPGSPAIDAGDPEVCAAAPVNNRDQRGFMRPGSGHPNCSIGAYEAEVAAEGVCVGDCDGNGIVVINELILGVNIALGAQPEPACPAFQNAEGMVGIAQLITGVNYALNGCGGGPQPTPTVTMTKCENGPVCAPTCGQKEGDPCCACPESGLLFCCSGPCVSDVQGGTVCGSCGEVGEACCPGNICNGVINCCGGYCTVETCGIF